ncbi:MAG TPA: MFS transporter, partial [Arachidicoccus soli]|nr:MFS transporter [Arachidicoccus soli]
VSLTSCFVSIFFLSISEILVMPFMATIAAERPSKAYRGSYMGLQGLSVSMAFVIMPYLATRIIEYHSFSTLWVVNVIMLIIGSVGFLFLKNKMPVL